MARTLTHDFTTGIPEAPIRQTLVLPCCWVCRKLFIDSGGDDPGIIREEHHPVPQAYGGAKGPTVSLCTGHHTLLHKIAEGMIAQGSPFAITPGVVSSLNRIGRQEYERLLYLSRVVYTAWLATKDDPNKKAPVHLELTGKQRRKLEALKSFTDLTTGEYISALIDQEYSKHFPT